MLDQLNTKKYLTNKYKLKIRTKDISIQKTTVTKDNEGVKGSNINELFEILIIFTSK